MQKFHVPPGFTMILSGQSKPANQDEVLQESIGSCLTVLPDSKSNTPTVRMLFGGVEGFTM